MASSGFPFFLPILFIVLMVAFVIAATIQASRRRKMLAQWATARGLCFSPEKDYGFDFRHPIFDCFKQGNSRYAFNVCSGEFNGWEIEAFDYHYTTGSGKNRHTHLFSGAIVKAPFPLKPLSIRPEGFFDKMTEFFGMDDIDFESAEFSRKFFVKSSDRKWAYDVLHTRAMEFLLERQSGKYYIEFVDNEILVRRESTFCSGEDFDHAIDTGTQLLAMIPPYVRQQMEQ